MDQPTKKGHTLDLIITRNEDTLKETLQQHVPQKRRIITLRPS